MYRLLMALPLSALAPTPALAAQTPKRPNVLIVLTDDQGLGDFSSTGNPVLKTPNFDAFARGAVRLTDFHVTPAGRASENPEKPTRPATIRAGHGVFS
jgi:hypothetical protein